MRKLILSILLLTGIAHGSVTYIFTYRPTSAPFIGFSAAFVVPTYLGGNGSETSMTPVDIDNGTTNWSLTKYRTKNIIGPQCFLFGTASVSLNDCGTNATNGVAPPDGSLTVIFLGNPTFPGTYTPDYFSGAFLSATGGFSISVAPVR